MSILVITNSQQTAKEYINNQISLLENVEVNLDSNQDVHQLVENKVIKVEQIRKAIQDLSNKPTQLKNTYLIIYNFEKATESSQNAFLKTLEEGGAVIYIHANSKSDLLETIISRVKVVELKSEYNVNQQLVNDLINIINNTNLNAIPTITKKYDAGEIYNSLEYVLNTKIENNDTDENLVASYKKLMEVKKVSNTVTLNTELQVTNIILGLINSK